jgi:hypothetical protein
VLNVGALRVRPPLVNAVFHRRVVCEGEIVSKSAELKGGGAGGK